MSIPSDNELFEQAKELTGKCSRCGSFEWQERGISRFGENIETTLICKICFREEVTKWRLFKRKLTKCE